MCRLVSFGGVVRRICELWTELFVPTSISNANLLLVWVHIVLNITFINGTKTNKPGK